jgi:hypothetical protein
LQNCIQLVEIYLKACMLHFFLSTLFLLAKAKIVTMWMILHESYLAINLGWFVLNQVEVSQCSLLIQSPRWCSIPKRIKKLFWKEINTVCHTSFLFIIMSALWVFLLQTPCGEPCRNVQIIISSIYTIGCYWNKFLQDTLPFLHFIFGLVRFISLAVMQCQ